MVIVREVGDVQSDAAIVAIVRNRHSHGCLLAPIFIERKAGGIARIFEGAVALVDVHVVRRRVIRNQQIRFAIAIDVHECSRKAVIRIGIRNSRFVAHIGKRTVTVVMEEMVSLALQPAWAAHHRRAAILAEVISNGGTARDRWITDVELHVAGNKDVEFAVAIVVTEGDTC